MRVTLHPQDLNSELLSWLCVKPILESVRGKDSTIKADAYNRLNEGQRALYIFYAFHNHSKSSILEFYWFSSYFISDLKGWPTLTNGLLFYGEESLVQICHDMKELVEFVNLQSDGSWRQAMASDLDENPELLARVTALFDLYLPTAEQCISHMNQYIRSNCEEFYILEN
ncbi:hypothetical protein BK133_28270 [Paenibacillus sp. FSL H8-0548]|uniref:hypothetical protein n=1 Tax=Paenibacillus sp. FSL H8-0548 TaxID=1920422 RepID=UPI00096E0275|nr:hypothetical protein [Paenibacillus sp. FSL H8-0548]OMF21465.1 hypothetical protein BK133_28270 [Paenibacillus sp. FSL H8-0548]